MWLYVGHRGKSCCELMSMNHVQDVSLYVAVEHFRRGVDDGMHLGLSASLTAHKLK